MKNVFFLFLMLGCTFFNCKMTFAQCNITATGFANIQCNFNGTGAVDGADDAIFFDLAPTGTGLGTGYDVTVSSGFPVTILAINQPPTNVPYVASTKFRIGPGSANGQPFNIIITDHSNPGCSVTIPVNPGILSCSTGLDAGVNLTNLVCNDNGTPGVFADDFLTFTIQPFPSGSNLGYSAGSTLAAFVTTLANGDPATNIPFGVPVNLKTVSGIHFFAGGSIGFNDLAGGYSGLVNFTNPCFNPPCDINSSGLSSIACNNNNTPTVTTDDYITFRLRPLGDFLGGGYLLAGDGNPSVTSNAQSPFPYGPILNFRLANGTAASGTYNLTITDFTTGNCTFPISITAPGVCSTELPPCEFTASGLDNVTCSDNGTPTNPADDYMVFTLNPQGANFDSGYEFGTVPGFPIPTNLNGSAALNIPYNQTTTFRTANGTANGTGGVYSILIQDDSGNCTFSESITAPGSCCDAVITPVCRTGTVTLNTSGIYVLTPDDVFNQGASGNSCGPVNFQSMFPVSVNCDQAGQTIPINVTVNDGSGNTATCMAQITVQESTSLPPNFSGDNVGNANGGNTTELCSGIKNTITASGFSTASADVQRLVSRQLCGNGEIIARVVSVNGSGWAGIILRETTAQGSKKVALKTQLQNNIRREIRATTNGAASNLNLFRPQDTWLRLVRSGNNFSGYTSGNGSNWNFAFSTTISMAGCIRVGLFSESINVNTTTTAVFDQVAITGAIAPLLAPEGETEVAYAMPDFQVYPNPTTGEASLDLSAFKDRAVLLEVTNIHGRVLKTWNLAPGLNKTERLDLSIYGDGVYLIVAKSEGLPEMSKRVVLLRN